MEGKRHTIILSLVTGFSLCVILVLYLFYAEREKRYGGFERNIVQNALTDSIVTSLPFNSYYLAGVVGNTLFLGNETSPLHLLIVQDDALLTKTIAAPNPLPRVSRILVDSPFFYLQDLEHYTMHSGLLASLRVDHPAPESAFFSEALPLSPTTVVQRTLSDKAPEYVLSKLTSSGQAFQYDLLEKQIDGLFCTDGMLQYDKSSQRFTYVYFYRNQFLCTDTSLNLLFRHNTIDTISRANVKVAKLASQDAVTLSSPPFIVNRRSAASDNKLFINSNILSDFEDEHVLLNNCIIDVYDLHENGLYLYSFYLPHYQGHKMKYFTVRGTQLFSIHDHYVIRYKLSATY